MFLERYGFLEETWFNFSFSPVTDETGGASSGWALFRSP